jgi:tripartite-type tricarboxylate transporter receptor subunit TctC
MPYDPVNDFSPIAFVASVPYVLVVDQSLPVKTVQQLIALVKSKPGQVNYASAGTGSTHHFCGELLKSMAGIDLTHVPYKGSAPAVNALLSGEVQALFSSLGGLIPHVRAGRLRTLGVTGPRRTPTAPEIPTIAEAGVPGFEVSGWYGLAATAKTPAATIERLNAAVNKSLPDLRERYAGIGADTAGGTAAEFNAYLKSETEKWARVVKLSGAKVE